MIALGVLPVAVPDETWAGDEDGYPPWFREAVQDLDAELPVRLNASETGELDFEQILDLAPDLILAPYSGISEADYERCDHRAGAGTAGRYRDPHRGSGGRTRGCRGGAPEFEGTTSPTAWLSTRAAPSSA